MSAHSRTRPVALIGLSGAGKTTVAPLLAARLGGEPIDLDARVAVRAGCSIAELFARGGESEFRGLERDELARAVDLGAGVIACGGGIVETREARDLLRRRCRGVWLEVEPAVAAARVAATAGERPLLGPAASEARLGELLARRSAWYAEVAELRVPTDGLAAPDVAERVARELEHPARAGGAA